MPLAATLCIWIALLSRSDGVFWFGSEAMLQFWLIFDCAMVGVLSALGYGAGHRARFVSWLAPCALLAVLGDASLTTWQAISIFTLHPWNALHAIAWSLAISGPLIASLFHFVVDVMPTKKRLISF